MLHIRPYAESDEDAVIALWKECELIRPWNNPRKDIARKLQVQRELFLVGTSDDRVVSSIMAGYEGHRGWVNYLAVSIADRGHGYGRQLMHHVEQLLLARDCPKINLQIRSGNTNVMEFYRAIGYAPDEAVSFGKRLITDEPEQSRI
jgi:ribosomal protein S18 acetylase RimI-like enzyme